MKNFAIHSGNFSNAGNFTGYTAMGESIFIHKAQMTSLGWTKIEDVKFPFYAIGGIKQINTRDASGNITDVKADRLQAFSVFTTKDALTSAHVDTAVLDISIKAAIKQTASAAGLTENELAGLMAFA